MTFPSLRWPGIRFESWALRGLLILCGTVICYTVRPFHLGAAASAGVGVVMTVVIVLAELRLRWAGYWAGRWAGLLGMIAAALVTMVISRTVEPEPSKSFLELAVLAAFGYLGLMLGSEKAAELHLERIGAPVIAADAAGNAVHDAISEIAGH